MATRRFRFNALALSATLLGAIWSSPARAQDAPAPAPAPAPAAPPAPAPAPAPAPPGAEPAPPAAPPEAEPPPEAPPPEAPPPEPAPVEPAPAAATEPPPGVFPPVQKPEKDEPQGAEVTSLPITTGAEPTVTDFGGEADLVSTVNEPHARAFTKKWIYELAGYLRAPMNVSYGPRNDDLPGTDNELHSPPRVVGSNQYDWNSVGLVPAPTAGLYLKIQNARVAANVLLLTDTYWDVGYDNLDEIGGVAQAYVTLKFPDAFGSAGGLTWTVGAFSMRYGMAGPLQQSGGYYQTTLFGRTHTTGELLTATVHLSEDADLLLEHGFGAKLEVVPYTQPTHVPPPPVAPWLPEQGPEPLGSNFLHHAHAALVSSGGLRLAAHYLESWTPNDFALDRGVKADDGRMRVLGGEVHLDDAYFPGNAYLGFSNISADDLLPLSDAIEVLHSKGGVSFKENFFGPLDPRRYSGDPGTASDPTRPKNDSGSVQTLLFQYMLKLSQLTGSDAGETAFPESPGTEAVQAEDSEDASASMAVGGADAGGKPDVGIALFGMMNHVTANFDECDPVTAPGPYCGDFTQDRFKFGGELSVGVLPQLSVGARFDQVMPDGSNADLSYSALSPRVIVHTNWISREYVILSYTRYFLGKDVVARNYQVPPGINPPDDAFFSDPDSNLVVLSAMASF